MSGSLTDPRLPAATAVRTSAVTRPPSAARAALRLAEARWALAASGLFALGGVAELAGAPAWLWWSLYLACYATGGWQPGLAGLRALRDKTLDVDLLMIVAAVLAASIGQVFDGGLLIVIFATSGALEAIATQRTQASVAALLTLAPEQATRLRLGGQGEQEETVATADLLPGDKVLVRPGERVGADGHVLDGLSEVDQASVTGEPLPVLKTAGDPVFAGTLNGTGALRVQVDKAAGESVLARIVALVKEASATKAKTQLFIEKVEQRYSVTMVTVTLALFLIPLAAGGAFQPTLLRAMTFMIVASPCAVVLATMPPLLAAIANAGRHGVLVKSAVVMEQLGTITQVAFDKTGTLTEGTPRVDTAELVDPVGLELGLEEVLALAAAAEVDSEHPIGRAVVSAAQERRLYLAAADHFTSTPGRGVTAHVDGRDVAVGSPALFDRPGDHAQAALVVDRVQANGATAVVVFIDGTAAAVLTVVDRVRPEAAATVNALTGLTGSTPLLLTGDNPAAGRKLAAEVGITDVAAGLLPADKADRVRSLQASGQRVLLVGDGVNDAPALAAADLGIAMGRTGSDLALDTADAVIVRDDLAALPTVIALSRRARRVVIANLAIASMIITALVVWDLAGHLPLPLAVAGHEGSTVIVGLNGLRLLRTKAWIGTVR